MVTCTAVYRQRASVLHLSPFTLCSVTICSLQCCGAVALARHLIAEGVAVDAATVVGETALHLAITSNVSAMVALLLSAGAPLDAQDHKGDTPVRWLTKHKGVPHSVYISAHIGANVPGSNIGPYPDPYLGFNLSFNVGAYFTAGACRSRQSRDHAAPSRQQQRTY